MYGGISCASIFSGAHIDGAIFSLDGACVIVNSQIAAIKSIQSDITIYRSDKSPGC